MINPLRSVYLNGEWYNFTPGTYSENINIKGTATDTQTSRTFSKLAKSPRNFSITLALENNYTVAVGASVVGATTWTGVSRLYNLGNILGAEGTSLPILFVTPYGETFSIVPTGSMDIQELLESPQDSGVEFRVSMTLAEI